MRNFVGPRLALLALICACAAYAQRDLATLVGVITDPSGAVVANAKVTITEVETGQVEHDHAGSVPRPDARPHNRQKVAAETTDTAPL